MHIRILRNSDRRMTWTDRKNGYIELLAADDIKGSGYYRDNKKFLSGFSAGGHPWNQAKYIDVFPEGFRAVYSGRTIDVSLLIDEQAFYVTSQKGVGILGAVPDYITYFEEDHVKSSADTAANGKKDSEKTAEVQKIEKKKKPSWHSSFVEGYTIVSSDFGIAVAAEFEFYYSVKGNNLELYASNPDLITAGAVSDEPFTASGWYVVFEDNEQIAAEKAVALAKAAAVDLHCKKVKSFLNKCMVSSGDSKFDEAVQWARFSGWMLAVKPGDSSFRGIWAGLPWFRDNWGRDTFISLCGILLSSGCFDEAKNVLLGFAGFQDRDLESPSYGRIPNRYRNSDDVIYNTADGTLWFIRALWEYVEYSGDTAVFDSLRDTVIIALDADIKRTDEHGFLKHGDSDTWMDARIRNKEPWSARGDRACDIQALWFTALRIGVFIMKRAGNEEKAAVYEELAAKVKKSFGEIFWNEDSSALADRLPPGGYGEWIKDMRVRPNQLFAITAPMVLPEGDENRLLNDSVTEKILENVNRELVNPFGLFSLCPDDPLFHPAHENPEMYHKDAAYHNGTIWEWNTGAYITAEAGKKAGLMDSRASAIIRNESKLIMDWGCAGSLSENIHACPDKDGNPVLSGTFSQAWSVAEYVRNICQDITGFVPRLAENRIELRPCLPSGCREWNAILPFGNNWKLDIEIRRRNHGYNCRVLWENNERNTAPLSINGIELRPKEWIPIKIADLSSDSEADGKFAAFEKFVCPSKWITRPFEKHDFEPEWCGAVHVRDYLENLVLNKRMLSQTSGGENTAALEWFFDSAEFNKKYLTDIELGALYSKRKTVFRLWAPTAADVSVVLYSDGGNSAPVKVIAMNRREGKTASGVWEVSVSGDMHGVYYQYRVHVHGIIRNSADPYARACGVNGIRSMVVDLNRTDPDGWDKVLLPSVNSPNDAVVYEVHVADITSALSWNGSAAVRRTYEGAAEKGTLFDGVPTGFDHICRLGVTHVQLLPVFDFKTVDESRIHDDSYAQQTKSGLFNWGYDPQNYGVPEGSYSSDPYNGEVRIKELKTLVKAFADEGIGVIMDVVFNHVKDGIYQSLGICVPGYYFRVEGYSGAGEDTASERGMFRRYMIDMLCYWLKEYKLCGFRFDLMGLHDVETMNEIRKALKKIKSNVLIYGEGWDMYRAGKMTAASMCNAKLMPGIGMFNDAIRCAVKGPVFDDFEPGFVHDGRRREAVKFGIVGATAHPQVDNSKVEGTANPQPWSENTWISVNYTEIHDNVTLHDKLELVEPGKPEAYYEQMQKMAVSLILLAEGMPILHAGMEFMRTKEIPEDILANDQPLYDVAWTSDHMKAFLRNSYNICDRINALDWNRCADKKDVVQYVHDLISMRKVHPLFRISSGCAAAESLKFLDNVKFALPEQVLAWEISGMECGDSWKKAIIIANPCSESVKVRIPEDGHWHLITDGCRFINSVSVLESGAEIDVKSKAVAVYADF